MFLVRLVILDDHVIKESCILARVLKLSHHSAKFGGHRYCARGDIMVLVHHVIWETPL